MTDTANPAAIHIELVVVADEPMSPPKLAQADSETFHELKQAGFDIRPATPEGEALTRGGAFYEIVTHLTNKETLATLAALFGAATPVLKYLLDQRKKKSDSSQIVIKVEGVSVTVDEDDLKDDTSLTIKFEKAHPEAAKKVSASSKVRVEKRVKKSK